jgi:hypothetical protein
MVPLPYVINSLQRHDTENSKQIFPEKELRGLSPNFHIPVSVSDLYIATIYSAPVKYVDRSWECINRSQAHEYENWDSGRANPFLGTHKWDFCCNTLFNAAKNLKDWVK